MRRFKCVAAIAVCTGAMYASLAGAERQLVVTTLEVPDAVSTNAQGINARGDVVGIYTDKAGLNTGSSGGARRVRDHRLPRGAHHGAARGIGPNGEIVGTYQRRGRIGRRGARVPADHARRVPVDGLPWSYEHDSAAAPGRWVGPRLLSRRRFDGQYAWDDDPRRRCRRTARGNVHAQRRDPGRQADCRTLHRTDDGRSKGYLYEGAH